MSELYILSLWLCAISLVVVIIAIISIIKDFKIVKSLKEEEKQND